MLNLSQFQELSWDIMPEDTGLYSGGIQVKKVLLSSMLVSVAASMAFAANPSTVSLSTAGPNWVYTEFYPTMNTPGSTTQTPTGHYNPGASLDIVKDGLNAFMWNVKVQGEGREYQAFNEIAASGSGNMASKTYGIWGVNQQTTIGTLKLDYKLVALSATESYVQIMWTLKNTATTSRSFDLYSFNDLDGPENAQSDAGSYGNNIFTFKGNTGSMYASSYGYGVTSYEMGAALGSGSVKDRLTDNSVTGMLSNSVAQNSGDLQGTFHYAMNVGANQSISGTIVRGYNVVPEPATFVALGAALLGVAARRRKK